MAKKSKADIDQVVRPTRPKRVARRFTLPERCDIRSFTMRELDGNDEIEASIWAEKNVPPAQSQSPLAMMAQEQKEAIRLSLVEVDDVPITPGVPYMDMDHWSMRTMRFVRQAFGITNGVEEDELKNFEAEASLVCASATAATEGPSDD